MIFSIYKLNEDTSAGISGESTVYRKIKLYNLDVIIAVDFCVKANKGTKVRIWVNEKLSC